MVTVLLVTLILLTAGGGLDLVRGGFPADLAPRPGLERRPRGRRGRPGRLPVPAERERPVLPVLVDEPAARREHGVHDLDQRAQFAVATPSSATRRTRRSWPRRERSSSPSTGRSRNATRTIQATLRRRCVHRLPVLHRLRDDRPGRLPDAGATATRPRGRRRTARCTTTRAANSSCTDINFATATRSTGRCTRTTPS